jgi:FKBP-type peptidyl-prolyl cis-trans isomerase
MIYTKQILVLLIAAFIFFGCKEQPQNEESQNEQTTGKALQEKLLDANRQAIKTENQQIDDFAERYGWEMKTTPTGLRYMIYENGTGQQAKDGMLATIHYKATLLNGDVVYGTQHDKPLTFRIGQDAALPTGIHEGILLLHQGDHAKIILLSHLAFGLTGDQNKVPQKSTLVYDLQLVDLK